MSRSRGWLLSLLFLISPPGITAVLAQGVTTPLEPQQALASLKTDPDLRIELVAAEPDVIDPVYIAFDAQGRMWVVQLGDYPNGPAPGEPGRSSIRILTDADGDGRYTDPQVFAEGLLFANSLMFWQDGVLVTTDGRLDFLADRDGDGNAEFRETWFEGFARENPQLRANSPTLGLDGMIYVANGLRGGKVRAVRKEWGEHEPVDISGRDFCFDPYTGQARATSGHGQFGMSFDDFGRRFCCSNRNPCIEVVMPEWALEKNRDVAVTAVVADAAASGEASRIYPISRFWVTSNLHAGQFTAACGVHIYRGDGLGDGYYGNSFTCDPTGNLVHRELLEGTDVVFKGRSPYDALEFISTEDTWFRPVNLAVGPEGALYLADMYRAVIEHPQYMPDELKTRPDLTLGSDRGRIYRVVSRTPAPQQKKAPKLNELSTSDLVAFLDHPNVWQRRTAFQLIMERQDRSVAAQLIPMLGGPASPQGKTLAFWALARLGSLRAEDLTTVLNADDPKVVEQLLVLQGASGKSDVLAAERRSIEPQLIEMAKSSASGQRSITGRLRFQLALALNDDPQALASLLSGAVQDQWLATAVAISSGSRSLETAESLLGLVTESSKTTDLVEPLGRLLEVPCSKGDLETLARSLKLVEALAARDPAAGMSIRSRLWSRLAAAVRSKGRNPVALFPEAAATAGIDFHKVIEEAVGTAQDDSRKGGELLDAIRLLEFAPLELSSAAFAKSMNSSDAAIAAAAVAGLGRLNDPGCTPLLLEEYSSRSPSLRREIQSAIFRSEPRIAALLDEIDAGRIPPTELDQTRMQQLARVKNAGLKERAAKLIAANRPADRSEMIEKYQPALSRKGDPAHGRELFTKNCAQCHRIGAIGVNVAPDISDSRVKLPSQLLTDILDPNRAIDNNYFNYIVVDHEGTIHSGVIATETSTSITLRQPEDKRVTIARENIEQLRSTGQSLMPVGLEKALTVEDMSDLISFIKNWRYLDGEVPKEVIR
ncbi:PVC-type heme-binding CxxCH protein [Caulifigura coniformis]|uniref:PVC-type heme-binding CxxCH protein n=1 Tax=Caulifigura coniformis TaxID=2527983 RepID=UPI0018D213A9|nr:PVC-type heme-binding CxxCH protein [Caulifigura coniformis]